MKKIKRKNVYIGGILFALSLLLLSGFIYYNSESNVEGIHSFVSIDGIEMDKLSKEEAKKILMDNYRDDLENKRVKLQLGEAVYDIGYDELGYGINIDEAIDEAYNIGRKTDGSPDAFRIFTLPVNHGSVEMGEYFTENKVDNVILQIAEKIDTPPRDAGIVINDNGLIIEKELIGKSINRDDLKNKLLNYKEGTENIEILVSDTNPKITVDEFTHLDKIIGDFTTEFSKSEQNRKDNIKLSAKNFSDVVFEPGVEISFNDTVGEISEKTGYKNAGVIVNGEFDRGIGGGICQVSTTLYNALIRADLEITERSNHSRPIFYVPLGTDAAVAPGYKDLKFINNTGYPIFVKTFVDDETIRMVLIGSSATRNYEVNIIPERISVIEPSVKKKFTPTMEDGEETVEKKGSRGYKYDTYKEIVKDGVAGEKEYLNSSYYIPQDKVVLIGTGEKKTEEKKDKKSENTKKSNKSSSKKSND